MWLHLRISKNITLKRTILKKKKRRAMLEVFWGWRTLDKKRNWKVFIALIQQNISKTLNSASSLQLGVIVEICNGEIHISTDLPTAVYVASI